MQDDVARLMDALARPAGLSSDFDLVPPFVAPSGRVLRAAAVLVPIWLRPSGPQVILTKRASHLKHHPGQIAFPGGKAVDSDADLERVYCTCRCDAPAGSDTPTCNCPSGFVCETILEQGGTGIRGGYCVLEEQANPTAP